VEAGLPEMQGRKDFYLIIASELGAAGMLTANLSGMVSGTSLWTGSLPISAGSS
jgi:hypothetical protein